MDVKISSSINFEDYEILIRKKGIDGYSSYCPQLNLMLTGTVHEEVVLLMQNRIKEHIESLKNS